MDEVRQSGTVVRVEGPMAIVRFTRSDACGHCNACFRFGSNQAEFAIRNTLNAKEGDVVALELHGRSVLKASVLAYGIPLISLLVGVFLGSIWSDAYAALGGVLFAAGSFFIMRALEPRLNQKSEFKPRMVKILSREEGKQE